MAQAERNGEEGKRKTSPMLAGMLTFILVFMFSSYLLANVHDGETWIIPLIGSFVAAAMAYAWAKGFD